MKKIVVITGSPRKKGNSFAMAEAFIQTAEAKGHTVTRFDAAHMSIGGCAACEACYKTENACIHNDDFNIIAPAIIGADVLVFTMPLYWFSFPGQIKNVLDKFYSFLVGQKREAFGKKYALITCAEMNDLSVFDSLRNQFKQSVAFLRGEVINMITIPNVHRIRDIDNDLPPLLSPIPMLVNPLSCNKAEYTIVSVLPC